MSRRDLFSRFLPPGRMHFAAHSHHPWPDVTYDAHIAAWQDAAEHMDRKWDRFFGEVVPEAQRHIARRLRLSDPSTVAFAPNSHELVTRLVSCLAPPVRILTTDGEFHSFRRQAARWAEARRAAVTPVPVEPFGSFPERFIAAARHREHDLIYLSHVFYDSGYTVPDIALLVAALPLDGYVVVDGYHGFMALPTDLAAIADRAFYVAGGYKYAMAGEGACFMHCPSGIGRRPLDTGWFAGFDELEEAGRGVPYPKDAGRFWGATFDPTGLYRFNAVQRMLDDAGIDVADIHRHVSDLQDRFVAAAGAAGIDLGELLPPWGSVAERGHFLTFRSPSAAAWAAGLDARRVVVDRRGDRLRIGFGICHDASDVDSLVGVLREIEVPEQVSAGKE